MRVEMIFALMGVCLVALVVGAFVFSRLAERKARDQERVRNRPVRRRRLREWAESLDGTYEEDVELFEGIIATEQVRVTIDDVALRISNVEATSGDAYGEVAAEDPHGQPRRGRAVRIGRSMDGETSRRIKPFDRCFQAEPSACPDDVTRKLLMELKDELVEGQTLLTWSDTVLGARLRVHLGPGSTLDRLCALVAHVVLCQPED